MSDQQDISPEFPTTEQTKPNLMASVNSNHHPAPTNGQHPLSPLRPKPEPPLPRNQSSPASRSHGSLSNNNLGSGSGSGSGSALALAEATHVGVEGDVSSALVPVGAADGNGSGNGGVPIISHEPQYGKAKVDHEYFKTFPPGYRFCPFDDELIEHYLKKKVNNEALPKNRIVDVELYKSNPDKLAEEFRDCGENEWYFFTPRDRKYKNGTRPNRAAGNGYWKATGADKNILGKGGIVVGARKTLVFYIGKAPKGDKTDWIMHEFRVKDDRIPINQRTDIVRRAINQNPDNMRLDDWVLCKIYKKSDRPSTRGRHRSEEYLSSPEESNPPHEVEMHAPHVNNMHGMEYATGMEDHLGHQQPFTLFNNNRHHALYMHDPYPYPLMSPFMSAQQPADFWQPQVPLTSFVEEVGGEPPMNMGPSNNSLGSMQSSGRQGY
ncbi:hypothetical protein Tsubulata_022052 [Turnera subulata]|uniref:NAC domain-containing protein n=1 Tax=Turnera subulata TaxID=218843 RepID=A0A9Q0G1L0_9ROSI|nr:hypothetical protein Tsubulata_022052 [Turnera subulata]